MEQVYQVAEGQLTRTVYMHIQHHEYEEAINVLKAELKFVSNNTAA